MALNGLSGSAGLNFDNVNKSIYEGIRTQETKLQTTISTIGSKADGAVSQSDMLLMQQQIQQWSMMVEIQSTITKQIADSLKDILAHHPLFQPMVFTVITQFTNFTKVVELPLMIFFDTNTFIKILDIIRSYSFMEEGKKETL